MQIGFEIWPQMRARHQRERLELVQCFADQYTIKEAAKILVMDATTLRTFAWQHGIQFKPAKDCK